jgi:peptidoglycan/LPS O-acetylase OafA/YrhL
MSTRSEKTSLVRAANGWLRQRFETSRATAGVNVRSMEGMRGYAVALVFVAHYCTLGAPWLAGHAGLESVAHLLHALGNTGVDLFFVLSGYVIYKSLVVRPQAFAGFMARRVKRIYPAFLAVLAIYGALSFVFPAESSMPREGRLAYVAANVLLLPGLFPIKPMITVAWSLSYEMFFYLAVPVVVAAFRACRFGAQGRTAAIAAISILLAACLSLFDAGHLRMAMFMAGMLLHEAIGSRQVRAPGGVLAAMAFGLTLLAGSMSGLGPIKVGLMFAGFFVLCLDCFLRPGDLLARAFCWTPLRWLGNMSYSYYLLHSLFLKALFMVAMHVGALQSHGAWAFIGLMLPFFAVSLAGSAVLFLLVERPFSLEAAHARPQPPTGTGVAAADVAVAPIDLT